MNSDCAGATSNRLEVVVWHASNRLEGVQENGTQSIAASHILCAALGKEAGQLRRVSRKPYRIGVVTGASDGHDLDAGRNGLLKAHMGKGALRNDDKTRSE